MTQTLSFRAEPSLAEELDAAATEAGVPRSDLRNQAVREFLYRLRCERDAERYALHPPSSAETAAWPNEAWPTIRGLTSELRLGPGDGLQRDCVVSFDNLHTLPRSSFRRRVAMLRPSRLDEACDRLADAIGCGDH